MGRIILFLITLGILVGGIFYFFNQQKNNTATQPEESVSTSEVDTFVEVPVLVNTTKTFIDADAGYRVDVHYPNVAILSHPDLAQEANAVLERFVQDVIESFKEDVRDTPQHEDQPESDLAMRWQALLVSPVFLSLRFDYSTYLSGAAHPSTETRIVNYHLEQRRLYNTEDIFSSSTQALPLLASLSIPALKEILVKDIEITSSDQFINGTQPFYENYRVVGVTKKGILVIFNPYQIAPYARGTIQAELPLSSFSENIKKEIRDAVLLAEHNIVEATTEEETSN